MSVSLLQSNLRVTGSTTIYSPNLSGIGGVTLFRSGDFVLISGAVGTGGSIISSGGTANISGLITTGQADLRYYPLLSNPSGYVTSGTLLNASGALQNQIANASAGVSSLNGLSGILSITPTGQNITVQTGSVGKVYVGVTGLVSSGDLALTGQNAINYTDARVAATGLANVNYTDVRVALTGQAAWVASQNNSLNLSGSINSSGRRAWDDAINLSGNLQLSGQKNWLFGTTLSGNLTATGALLSNISGWADFNFVHKTGDESITGIKTFNSGIFMGGIGIGTQNPRTALQISGSGFVGSTMFITNLADTSTERAALILQGGNAGGGTLFAVNAASRTTPRFGIPIGGYTEFVANGGSGILLGTITQVPIVFGVNDTEYARISSSGNFGVGTANPIAKLDVSGSAIIGGNVALKSGINDSAKIISSDYSILSTDYRVYCNNANPITLTFPNVLSSSGQSINIKLLNTGAVYFTGVFTQKFDGSDLYVAAGQYNAYSLHAFVNNWNLW